MNRSKKFIIVCVILTGFGFFLTGLGAALGGRITGIGLSSRGLQIGTPQYPYGINYQSPVYKEDELSLDAFTDISLYAEYADVSVVKSDHYGIFWRSADTRIPAVDVQNGVLTVTQNNKNKGYYGADWYLFNVNFSSGSIYTEEEVITIYVPEDAVLEEILLESNYGNTALENVGSSSLTISNDYGDITLKNVKADRPGGIDIHMESGTLDMRDVTAESLRVFNNYGDLDLQDLLVSGEAAMKLESGSLDMENAVFGSLNAKSNYGDITGDTVSSPDTVFTLESGTCRVRDFSVDSLTVDSSYGSAKFTLTSPLSDYSVDLDTDYGNISLNGAERKGGGYVSRSDNGKLIKISCESGDISVDGTDR